MATKDNMSIQEKLAFLRKLAVQIKEIANYFGWSITKTYRIVNKLREDKSINLVARFEADKVNLDNFLRALGTSRDEQIDLIIRTNPSDLYLQSEKIKAEELPR